MIFSITANPLLGVFSDFLIAQGGTTVLTNTEMFGGNYFNGTSRKMKKYLIISYL